MTATQTDSKEFSGKRALVTGGTKGMGEAIVRRLRLAGATVIITARSKPNELQSPELFIQSDISTPDGVDKVVKEVLTRFDGVDILINNVGGSSAPSGGMSSNRSGQRPRQEMRPVCLPQHPCRGLSLSR